MSNTYSTYSLLMQYKASIASTWCLVIIENVLFALLPFFIGRAIDDLLQEQENGTYPVLEIQFVMIALIVVAMTRRFYDTRAYGSMRVGIGRELFEQNRQTEVSILNAHVEMSRELVSFFENYIPELLTAIIQIVVCILVLWAFDYQLGLNAVLILVFLCLFYSLFHKRFYHLNSESNSQMEKQVYIIESRDLSAFSKHLARLRRIKIGISDADSFLFGGIYFGVFGFVLTNLVVASMLDGVTSGTIFSIVSYSWSLVIAGTTLPMTLQQWARLRDIQARLGAGVVE